MSTNTAPHSIRNEAALLSAVLGACATVSTSTRGYAAIGGVVAIVVYFSGRSRGRERRRLPGVVVALAAAASLFAIYSSLTYLLDSSPDTGEVTGDSTRAPIDVRVTSRILPDALQTSATMTIELKNNRTIGTYYVAVGLFDGDRPLGTASLVLVDFRPDRPVTRTVLVFSNFAGIPRTHLLDTRIIASSKL